MNTRATRVAGPPPWLQPLIADIGYDTIASAAADTPLSVFGTDIAAPAAGPRPAPGALWRTLATTIRHPTLDTYLQHLVDRLAHDEAVLAAGGRWRIGEPDPEPLVPGDVVAVRSIASTVPVLRASAFQDRDPGLAFGLAAPYAALCAARHFWVPGAARDALVAADAPDDQWMATMALPAPLCAVWFADELPIPPADLVVPDTVRAYLDHVDTLLAGSNTSFYGPSIGNLESAALERDGRITGMLLLAGPDRQPLDVVIWIVSVAPPPDAPPPGDNDRIRGFLFGFPSRSTLGPLVRVAAATVAWGRWHQPAAPLTVGRLDPATTAKAARTGAWRRREPAGAFAAVRVLDLAATVPSADPATRGGAAATLARLSPIPHWRRPHPRLVRVGSRSDWHYEVRHIAATQVLPHGPVRSGEVVWRIPPAAVPAEPPARPDDVRRSA